MKKKKSKRTRSFGEREFVRSLWKTMKEQELRAPEVGLVHERLEGTVKMVGLTGGIACGKTAVAQMFQKLGLPVIDADEIARFVVQKGKKAYKEVVEAFGEGIAFPSGELDRARLAEIVFSDESKRSLLESITHPEIFREILKRVKELKKKKQRVVMIDAALLFESGLSQKMHKNILVRINPEVQLKRLMARDGLSEMEAWQRILAQMPGAEKEKRADLVIDNSGSLAETQRQVESILPRLSSQ